MNPYNNVKALWHFDRITKMKNGLQIVPVHIHMIISDLCNQNCSFCAYRMDGGFSTENFGEDTGKGFTMNPNRMIPKDRCFEIIRECSAMGVKAIQFTGGGEPTVHPYSNEIFNFAQRLGIKTALVTNGTKLPPKEILERFQWIRVSLDAGSEEIYEKVRESKRWPRVMENLELLGKLENPYVGVGFVVTKENFGGLSQACRIVKGFGLPYVRVAAMFSENGTDYYKAHFGLIRTEITRAKALESDTFKVVDLFGRRIEDLNLGIPKYSFCGYQQLTVYIGGDLNVYRCCTTAYTTHGQIGSLKNQSFRQWWEKEAWDAYREFNAHSCHHCQFNAQNEILAQVVSNEPMHSEFV